MAKQTSRPQSSLTTAGISNRGLQQRCPQPHAGGGSALELPGLPPLTRRQSRAAAVGNRGLPGQWPCRYGNRKTHRAPNDARPPALPLRGPSEPPGRDAEDSLAPPPSAPPPAPAPPANQRRYPAPRPAPAALLPRGGGRRRPERREKRPAHSVCVGGGTGGCVSDGRRRPIGAADGRGGGGAAGSQWGARAVRSERLKSSGSADCPRHRVARRRRGRRRGRPFVAWRCPAEGRAAGRPGARRSLLPPAAP